MDVSSYYFQVFCIFGIHLNMQIDYSLKCKCNMVLIILKS
jgi:hypothetical protein